MVAIRDIVKLNEAGVGDFEIDPGTRASFQGITATWQGNVFVVNSITPEAQAAHPNVRVNQPLPKILRGGMVNAARALSGLPRLDFDGGGNLRSTPAATPAAPPSQRTPGNGNLDDIRADPADRPDRERTTMTPDGGDVKQQARQNINRLQGPGARAFVLRAFMPGNFRPLTNYVVMGELQAQLIELNNKAIQGTIEDFAEYNRQETAVVGLWITTVWLPVVAQMIAANSPGPIRVIRQVASRVIWFDLGRRDRSNLTPRGGTGRRGLMNRIVNWVASEAVGTYLSLQVLQSEFVMNKVFELIMSDYANWFFSGNAALAASAEAAARRYWPEEWGGEAIADVLDVTGVRPIVRTDGTSVDSAASAAPITADDLQNQIDSRIPD